MEAALGLGLARPTARARVTSVAGQPGARLAADRGVALLDEGVDDQLVVGDVAVDLDVGQRAMGFTLIRPRRSRATIGARTRLSASARRRPLIHAALPLRARSSWPTLTAEQQFSGSACHNGSFWRATVMIRRFSP